MRGEVGGVGVGVGGVGGGRNISQTMFLNALSNVLGKTSNFDYICIAFYPVDQIRLPIWHAL